MSDSPLRQHLRALLLDARRGQDRSRTALLRGLLAELDNAEAAPTGAAEGSGSVHVAGATAGVGATEAPRRDLTEADERELVVRGLADVEAALPHLERADPARAAEERASLDAVRAALGIGR